MSDEATVAEKPEKKNNNGGCFIRSALLEIPTIIIWALLLKWKGEALPQAIRTFLKVALFIDIGFVCVALGIVAIVVLFGREKSNKKPEK